MTDLIPSRFGATRPRIVEFGPVVFPGTVAKDPLRLVVPQDETEVDALPPLELDQVGSG